ncbi:Rha family transcriptional regulator [Psychrobacillus sp. NPDC096426]|uniref:Rha family transcriptional regulator n=1 Tax=Psychrobacillus sp. NPDC096426 TaxID=3364491 RepID=UPI0038023CEC
MDIINFDGQLVTDSRDVTEMFGRPHDKVICDIRNIPEQLGDTKIGESYFIESTYTNSQNK